MFSSFFVFFNDTATTEIYTLSLHDALPIFVTAVSGIVGIYLGCVSMLFAAAAMVLRTSQAEGESRQQLKWFVYAFAVLRSEEHTSELQSRQYLVCRLLLEKKKNFILLSMRF